MMSEGGEVTCENILHNSNHDLHVRVKREAG